MKKSVPSGKIIFTDLDPMHPPKLKRHRRTKLEMLKYREDVSHMTGDSMARPIKSSHKQDLEAERPISKHTEAYLKEATKTKQIEGWVNVYKGDVGDYWLGSDIHTTIEDARKIAGKNCTQQIQISFSVES